MNKIVKWILAAAAAVAMVAPAHADTTWDWSFSSGSVNASGEFVVAGDGSTPSAIQSITGIYSDSFVTNAAITGLVALGTDGAWLYNNLFGGANGLDLNGFVFSVAGLTSNVNVWFDGAGPYVSGTHVDGSYQLTNGDFTATQAVPEPESAALMLAGLGALVLVRRRRFN